MPTTRRAKAYTGHPPPSVVVMLGCDPEWREAEARVGRRGKPTLTRDSCPNGCGARDLDNERRLGLEIICLRCLCHTDDPPGWSPPLTLAVLVAEKKAKAAAIKAASLAERRFSGRKASKRAAIG